MSDRQAAAVTLELAHTMLSEEEALRFLDGHRITRGGRIMDPKAQIVGEFVKSIRVPGYYPPLPELRQQLRTMVSIMDAPAPALPRIEDIRIPGPAGPIGARVYDPAGRPASSPPGGPDLPRGGSGAGGPGAQPGPLTRPALPPAAPPARHP